MNKHLSHHKLTLPDKYTERPYAQMNAPAYSQQRERTTQSTFYAKPLYSQQQGVTRRRKRRSIALLGSLSLLSIIMMSLITYVLVIYNQSERNSVKSSPNLTVLQEEVQARIGQLATDVNTIKQTRENVSVYQQKLAHDQAQFSTLASSKGALALLVQTESDLASLQGDLADNNVSTLLSNFEQEAQQWGNAHKYHDPYDGKNYFLNSSYLNMDGHNGIHYGESAYMSQEVSAGNPQAAQDIKDDDFLLSMLEANDEDFIPYNQPHQVDQPLLNYFGYQHTRVLIVSLTEQAVRMYNNGQLEQAFQVTTGRVYRPTPVGHFQLTQHFYNLTLTSADAPGSPDYYAPVTVQNAIQFWSNGYYMHSSSWRTKYGPFTQFPHHDSDGNSDARVGSHGCINVSPAVLSKLDNKISYATPLIIF